MNVNVLGIMQIVVGIIFILFGIIFYIKRWLLIMTGENVTATVVGIVKRREKNRLPSERTTLYAPVMEYFYAGQKYKSEYKVQTASCKYTVGNSVEVICNKSKPEQFAIKNDKAPSFIIAAIIFLGTLIFLSAFWW